MKRRPVRQFYFRLAGHLGMTVGELLGRIDSRELTEWMVYEKLTGPLGGRRTDYAAGIVAAAVTNANRGKGSPVRKAEDFVPQWGGKTARRKLTPEELWAKAREMNVKLGGSTVA